MIDYIRYRMALRQLSKQKRKIRSSYANDLASARAAGKNINDLRSLESEAWFEVGMVDEAIALLITDFLVSKADKHFIATPSRKERVYGSSAKKLANVLFCQKQASQPYVQAFEPKQRNVVILSFP